MSTLERIQQDVQAYVLQMDDNTEKKIFAHSASALEHWSVYQNAYTSRLCEVLSQDYPKLLAYLGEKNFFQLARNYLKNYPSRVPNARYVGMRLSVYLKQVFPEDDFFSQLALFEWSLGVALDAADAKPLGLEDLQAIPAESWPEMVFQLHPSVQILPLSYNVPAIWKALEQQQVPPERVQQTTSWVVWRRDLDSHFCSLEPSEAKAMALIQRAEDFSAVCDSLYQELGEETETLLVSWLLNWCNQQMLALSNKSSML